MNNTYFMIRNKETGLYSSGGQWPSWGNKGKIWKKRNSATAHITLAEHSYKKDHESVELVEFEFEPKEISITDVKDVIAGRDKRRQHDTDRRRAKQEIQEYRRSKEMVSKYEAKQKF